jgi:hypothetical protein
MTIGLSHLPIPSSPSHPLSRQKRQEEQRGITAPKQDGWLSVSNEVFSVFII